MGRLIADASGRKSGLRACNPIPFNILQKKHQEKKPDVKNGNRLLALENGHDLEP